MKCFSPIRPKYPNFQALFRESLPTFPIVVFKTGQWRTRRVGTLSMPNGVDIEYRRRGRNKVLFLRVRAKLSQWSCIETARVRRVKGRLRLVCPTCVSACIRIYATGPRRGQWRCDHCIGRPSAAVPPKSRKLVKQIAEGNLLPTADMLRRGGDAAITAMRAMGSAGVSSNKLKKGDESWTLRPWRSPQSVRTRSRGRLLFVGGRLHVR